MRVANGDAGKWCVQGFHISMLGLMGVLGVVRMEMGDGVVSVVYFSSTSFNKAKIVLSSLRKHRSIVRLSNVAHTTKLL